MRYKFKKPNRRRLIIALVCLVLIIIFLGRGWIRNDATTWYGNHTAGNTVDAVFKDSFSAINQQIQMAGVKPSQPDLIDPICWNANFHFFHVTVNCMKSADYENGPIPQAFVTNWPIILNSLHLNKTQQSWRVGTFYPTPPTPNINKVNDPQNLFTFKSTQRNELGFVRQTDGVKCELDIDIDPSQGAYLSHYSLHEGCFRDINFF